jgi:hypothetical protein
MYVRYRVPYGTVYNNELVPSKYKLEKMKQIFKSKRSVSNPEK